MQLSRVILAAILCIIAVSSGLSGVMAQPPLIVSVSQGRRYYTSSDSVAYDQSLKGNYAWSITVRGEATTPVGIEVLTPHTFRDPDPWPNSTTRQNSQYAYRWDGEISDISRMRVLLLSDLEVTFRPGLDSERTVSPEILDEQVVTQTLQVKVTPREDISNFSVSVSWDENREVKVTPVPDSDQPKLEAGIEPRTAFWRVESPVNGMEYEFSVRFSTENRLHPSKVFYKPEISIGFTEPGPSRTLTNSTVTVEDDILGKVTVSTPSESRWRVRESSNWRVHYQQESAVWGVESTATAMTLTETAATATTVPAVTTATAATGFTVAAGPTWLGLPGGYAVFVTGVAVLVTVSLVLFWKRRSRRALAAAKRVVAAPAVKGYCIFCGAPIEADQEFCMQCGKRQIRIERPRIDNER